MKNTNKKGFTIVELVIVIAVIAILAAVLIPTFVSLTNKANLSADQQAARQMSTALATETKVDTLQVAINTLEANGFNAAETLVPVTKAHSFYWYKTYNTVVLVNDNDNTVVFPTDEKYSNGFAEALAKTGDDQVLFNLEGGVKYIDVAANDVNTLEKAFSNGTENITLNQDVALTPANELEVPAGAEMVVDLNGKAINAGMVDSSKHMNVLHVKGKVTLKNGTINTRNVMVYDGGELIVEDGVEINALDSDGGACIWAYDGSKVTINGGTFNTNSFTYAIVNGGGTITINNATVTAARGCVSANSGTTIINDGTFTVTGGEAHTIYSYNSAVTVNGGTFANEGTGECFCLDSEGTGSISVAAGVVEDGVEVPEAFTITNPTETTPAE